MEFELRVKHKGTQATFLDLDITIKDNSFIYRLFDKKYKLPFFVVRMSHLSSYILVLYFMVRFIQNY